VAAVTVRFYFYAGSEAIRVVHSFVFDGDANKDFIKGLGLAFSVPLREEVQNRQVRFGGTWKCGAEPVKPLVGRRVVTFGQRGMCSRISLPASAYQLRRIAAREQAYIKMRGLGRLPADAIHGHGFTIREATSEQSSWLHAA